MKLTKIDKTILGVMALLVVVMGISVHSCKVSIEKKGGFKQVIIDTGREIKSIKEEISK